LTFPVTQAGRDCVEKMGFAKFEGRFTNPMRLQGSFAIVERDVNFQFSSERSMRCPRCKMEDVYLSSSGSTSITSFLTKTARCHRCCYLFKVALWNRVPEKSASSEDNQSITKRRVA
jgi:hypothetical protein